MDYSTIKVIKVTYGFYIIIKEEEIILDSHILIFNWLDINNVRSNIQSFNNTAFQSIQRYYIITQQSQPCMSMITKKHPLLCH